VSNWYKKSWNNGIPLMEEYSKGIVPPSSSYRKDPRSLVNNKPEFGGNERPGYPRNFSQNKENEDDKDWSQLHGKIPGESILMDDGGDSREGLGDRFVADGEFHTDKDKIIPNDLDNIDLGPHNMQRGSVFNRIKKKTTIKGLKL